MPLLYNLEWDPREEHQVDFPHAWVLHPMAAAAGAFLKSLAIEPPIKPGTPDPYTPPEPGQLMPAGAPADRPHHPVRHHPPTPRRARPADVSAAPARARAEPSAGRMSGPAEGTTVKVPPAGAAAGRGGCAGGRVRRQVVP